MKYTLITTLILILFTQCVLCMDLVNYKRPITEQLTQKRSAIDHELTMMLIYALPYDGELKKQVLSLIHAYHHDYDDLAKLVTANKQLLGVRTSNNYSAMGIAMIKAKEKTLKKQKEFIKQLRSLGFIPTIEDKALAFLTWQEQIDFDKIIFMLQAYKHQTCIFSTLPHDLIKTIASSMMRFNKPLF